MNDLIRPNQLIGSNDVITGDDAAGEFWIGNAAPVKGYRQNEGLSRKTV